MRPVILPSESQRLKLNIYGGVIGTTGSRALPGSASYLAVLGIGPREIPVRLLLVALSVRSGQALAPLVKARGFGITPRYPPFARAAG